MTIEHVFAGIAVADLGTALAWYERLWGRPADLIPNDNEAAWQLGDASWIYVVGDAERAGNALLTVLVDDLDRHVAELVERGLAPGPIETIADVVRQSVIADPEGNRISFGQPG